MKKTISLAIALVMAITSVFCVNFAAFADPEATISSFSFTFFDEANALTYTEGFDSRERWDDDDNRYNYYNLPDVFTEGNELTLVYSDTTTDTFTATYNFDDDEVYFVNKKDEKAPISDIFINDTQDKKHWKVGTNKFKIYLYDNDDNEFNVTKEATVLDNNIASISFSFAQTPQVREYTDGYADYRYDVNDNKECFYYYNLPTVYSNGNKLTLKMKDESIKVYTYKNGGFYDSEDNELRAEIDTSSEQYSKHWSVGSNNEFTIECLGFSTTAKATVVSSGIKSVSFTPATPYVITENDSKYSEIETDEYGTKYIYYYSDAYDFYKEGNKFTVTFTNGSTTEYTCRKDNYGDLSYLDSNNKYMPYDYCRYNTQYKNHWTPSANNAFYVYLCGQTLAVPVTIAHAWSGWTVTSTATCTTAGSKYRTCSVCGAKDVVNEPAAGHKWKVTKVYKNATFKKAGSGKYKCTVCGATKKDKIPKLGKVNAKKVKVKAGKKQFTLSWTPVANIGGYQIQYSTSKKFGKGTKTVNVKGAKTSKKTIKKLGKKKTYYVRIRACKKIGKKVQYSAWTAAKKVKTK